MTVQVGDFYPPYTTFDRSTPTVHYDQRTRVKAHSTAGRGNSVAEQQAWGEGGQGCHR